MTTPDRQRQSRLWVFFAMLGSLVTSVASAQAKKCDAACLRSLAESYLTAIVKRDAGQLPLDAKVKYTENGKTLKLNEGLWKGASAVGDFKEIYVDASTGNALVLAVVDEGGAPAILATRLKSTGNKVNEIESVVARKGSHPLFTPELMRIDPLFSAAVDPDTRVPRKRMIEIADAYFNGIERNSSQGIQATPDCNRFENGTKTTFRTPTSGNCAKSADALNYIKAVKDRRYFIVDETTGVVACTIVFDIPGGDPIPAPAGSVPTGSEAQLQTTLRQPRMLLLTELFKIEGGNISRIQAVMNNLPHGAKSGWEKK
jgi:hypothetical protein